MSVACVDVGMSVTSNCSQDVYPHPSLFVKACSVFIAKPAQRGKKKDRGTGHQQRFTTSFWLSFVVEPHKYKSEPHQAAVGSGHPFAIPTPLLGKGRRRGALVGVRACVLGGGWLCSASKSLSLSMLGVTRRYLELNRAVLLNFLLSMLTGGFWMVFAYLSSPVLLRGYLVLTAWHLLGFGSLNEHEARQGKIFWHDFIIDVVML